MSVGKIHGNAAEQVAMMSESKGTKLNTIGTQLTSTEPKSEG